MLFTNIQVKMSLNYFFTIMMGDQNHLRLTINLQLSDFEEKID